MYNITCENNGQVWFDSFILTFSLCWNYLDFVQALSLTWRNRIFLNGHVSYTSAVLWWFSDSAAPDGCGVLGLADLSNFNSKIN